MNRRWIGIWGCIAAMCAAAGCSSDGVSGQEDALECGDGENSESGKTPVQPSDPCKWSCQEGTYVCGESGVMKCVKSEGDECPVMILDKTCPDGTNCNARTHECDPDCRSVCEENDTKCIENGYVTCRPDDSGCLKWGGETACLEDEHCVNGKCVSSCPDGNCEEPCTDECEPGQSVCNDNQIRTCGNYDDDSCLEWSEATDCPEGEACNGDGTACEDPCIDACSVGEKKCDGNVLAECIEEPGFNCPVWKRTNCAKNQYCDSEKTECRYACGDDCEPFSIIIIPDTQYMVETSARMNLNNQSVTKENSLMMHQMKWIVDNQTKENIRFVIHLGDVTQYNWSMASNDEQKWENEWEHSVYAIEKLAQAGIRFSISTGNHDYVASDLTMLLPARNKTKFCTYYNEYWLKDN